ncbi:bifunctional copper resistance protein CopD/cytochrome c oxidase assembly protein [Pontimonas sp.]|nr:bifunctional copper resistance protein CopD/cytochrome c oxidase assembly protein [Pontimonas sp.]
MNTRLLPALTSVVFLLLIGLSAALLVGLATGGGAQPLLLADPGAIARYGLPSATALVHLGAALSIGSLMMAALVISSKDAAFNSSLVVAAIGAGLTTVASVFSAFFTFAIIYVEPVSFDQRFGEVLWLYLGGTEVGRAWLVTIALSALVTVLVVMARSFVGVFVAGLLAVASLWPLAEQGHAAGTANHEAAVSASFTHSVFAAMWIGGLAMVAVIAWSHKPPARKFHTVLSRYSTIALVSFLVVAASGVTNAWLRVGEASAMFSAYGALVAAKVVALLLLGGAGALYRTRLLASLASGGRGSTAVTMRVVAAELALMGVASGLASALARTATPVPEIPATELAVATPSEILTGELLPPEFEWSMVITTWQLDLLWALIVVFAIVYYLWGHLRLAKRGDSWPVGRTIAWVSGMVVLGITTNAGLGVYGTYLFSVHMVAHMILSMAIPLLLVLGAPVTLASRAIAGRKDGSRGPREWILAAVHSRYLGFLGHPLVAAVIFGLSLIVFYYSPLFSWALEDHLGHQWMIVHFLASGYLFAQSLVGIDPTPHNPPYPLRLIIVLATMGFHAFFGLSLIYGTGLLVPEWYGAMGREWGPNPLLDQQNGGEIAWGLGEFPTLALAILVAWSWSRSDERANKRRDRRVDAVGDTELDSYNEMLRARAGVPDRPRKG